MEVRFRICAPRHINILRRPSHHQPAESMSSRARDLIPRHLRGTKPRHLSTQANPVGGFYESLLENPLPSSSRGRGAPAAATPRTPSAVITTARRDGAPPSKLEDEVAARARVVFGSRLAGPAERRRVKERDGTMVAGIRVPPRPEEPENCCMSGCVNCVWDVFRDDVEEWAAMRRIAERALAAQMARGGPVRGQRGDDDTRALAGMDDDGGGSETNWGKVGDGDVDEDAEALFGELPVGIREFMRQEKRLKAKHRKQADVAVDCSG